MRKISKKSRNKSKRALFIRTIMLISICGVAAFGILVARLYDIQISNHSYYQARALSAQQRPTTLSATRGTIFDINGNILAMSAAVEKVFISPLVMERENQDVQLIATGLSGILGVDRDMIIERASRTSTQYQRIKLQVSAEEAALVREFISEHSLRGVHLAPNTQRYYPNNSLAGQVLGFVGTDDDGLEGLEHRYNSYLSGVDGRQIRLASNSGRSIGFPDFEDRYEAEDGYDITLTIDTTIQYYVESHLVAAIEQYRVLNGAVCIAMDPRTGAILAMASYPNFDPNDFLAISESEMERLSEIEDETEFRNELSEAQSRQWRNRALTDTYEPGSVFKIVTHAMAIEENIAGFDSQFNCSGSIDVLGRINPRTRDPMPMRCANRWGHGTITLNEAMSSSCNIVCVNLAVSLGSRTFYDYIEAFGLFERSGLDNASESLSFWWDESVFVNRNNHARLAAASIGQTFTITPIQMISAVSAAINGGNLMQPYLVSHISDSNGNVIRANEPTVIRQVISAGTSEVMRVMLENVVENGTGRNAQVSGYRVGGKTGTSENVVQIALAEEGAQKDLTVSFVGFAPADDPQIVILLLLDTPCTSTGVPIFGGSMAAPVVGNMLADILPLALGIMPHYSEEQLQDISVAVPNVTEIYLNSAIGTLMGLGLEYTAVGDGTVVTAQLPAPNSEVAPGTVIRLFLDTPPPDGTVVVPDLFGMTFEGARRTLENHGLFIRAIGVPKSDTRARVSVQSIPRLEEVAYGTVIIVTLIDKDVVELTH